MKSRIFLISLIFLIFTGCVGISSTGIFGTGVSVALDPRSLGTQIDDSVMQKNLTLQDNCTVFFISPRKFNKSVKDIKYYFSGRKILVCREMTKFYEEYIRTDIDDLEPFVSDPKGELTIVISEKNKKNLSIVLNESDKKNIQMLIKKLSIKDITDLICQKSNVPKKEVYNYCLKLKNEK